jgi:hypothetical protein
MTLSSIYDSVIWKSKKRILYNIELERGERGGEEEKKREKEKNRDIVRKRERKQC